MKSLFYPVLFLLMVFAYTACGGGENSTAAAGETTEEEMEQEAGNQITGISEAMQEAQKALKEAGMGEAVEPVNFRELKKLLPASISGMELTDESGQTSGAMGFNVSQAEVEYSGSDGERITVSIFDTGGIAMAAMGLAAWTDVTIDKEDSRGYERTTTIDGYKAYEKYNKNSQSGEISIFADQRFILKVEGRKVTMDRLREVLTEVDLSELKEMI